MCRLSILIISSCVVLLYHKNGNDTLKIVSKDILSDSSSGFPDVAALYQIRFFIFEAAVIYDIQ